MRLQAYILVTILLAIPFSTYSQEGGVTEDPEAREIFEEVDRRRDLITYETADMKMVIHDGKGRTRNREIVSYSYNRPDGDVSKSLLLFEAPANVRGTGFLTLSEGADEVQKLYLPALGRIQIISASEKSDRFMGSDFTYEDLGDQAPGDYLFELESKTDTAYVLKARKKQSSQYDWLYFYIDPEKYALQRVEYFNEADEMIKRLEAGDFRNVQAGTNETVWRPDSMVMYDLREGRKTELAWSNRRFGREIPGWRFTERGLRRGL